MVQREVAERVAAAPGEMSYLSVFVQYHAKARVAFRVPREAFEPAPKVESAVLVLEPFPDRRPAGRGGRGRTCGASSRPGSASGARCSTTCSRASSRSLRRTVDAALDTVGIARDRRPQTVAVGEWIALAEALGPIPDAS